MAEPPIEVTEEQFRVVKARLGIEAESFENSHVGRYIYNRIDVDLDKFTQDLINCDPEDAKENRRIRNDIQVRNLFTLWIKEAIRSGLNAEHELQEAAESPDY